MSMPRHTIMAASNNDALLDAVRQTIEAEASALWGRILNKLPALFATHVLIKDRGKTHIRLNNAVFHELVRNVGAKNAEEFMDIVHAKSSIRIIGTGVGRDASWLITIPPPEDTAAARAQTTEDPTK